MLVYLIKGIDSHGNIRVQECLRNELDLKKRELLFQGYTFLSWGITFSLSRGGLGKKDLLFFIKSLGVLINANLDLSSSLKSVYNSTTSKNLKNFVFEIQKGISNGKALSSLLREKKWRISPVIIELIGVGERVGSLRIILNKLTSYLEDSEKIKSKLKVALAYPIIILILLIIFAVVFLNLILPGFLEMFSSTGPGVMEILISREKILKNILLAILILSGTVISLLVFLKKDLLSIILLKIPVFGGIILDFETLNLLFSLKILWKNIPIEESLQHSVSVLKNRVLIGDIHGIREKIIRGELLSRAFSETNFPKNLGILLSLGEKTGEQEKILDDLYTVYFNKTRESLGIFMALIDPLVTIFIGGILFSIIILFVLPLLTSLGGII